METNREDFLDVAFSGVDGVVGEAVWSEHSELAQVYVEGDA